MAAPSLATEAARAGDYPSQRFNQRERKLLESVKTYVDALSPDTVITTQGDLIIGNASGDAVRLAKGTSGLPLVAGASTVSYAALTDTGLASNSVTTAKIAADAVDNTKLADNSVSLEQLDSGIEFSHRVFAAGEFTTAGGDANESISVPGALASDLAFVFMKDDGATPRTIIAAASGTDAIDVIFSGDPSTDHTVTYMLLRAAS